MAAVPQIAEDSKVTLTHRSRRDFELREADFGKDTNEAINKWVWEQINVRRKQLENLHKHKVPEWRRIASGKPREENKSWPFPNCANLVYQLVGQSVDELASRVIGLLYETSPLAYFEYFTEPKDQAEAHHNARKSELLEKFIDVVGYEPEELDLRRIESLWFSDSAKLGTAWVAAYPEKVAEAVYVGYVPDKKKTAFEEDTLYEGPKCRVLRYEDVLFDPDADTPEESEWLSRKVTLSKRQLQERAFRGIFNEDKVRSILGKPDRYGPGEIKKREQLKKGIQTDSEEHVLAEWDIEEGYFYWYKGKKKFRLICWYHFATKTMLNLVFNFIPDNRVPLVRTRLSMDEHGMIGRGYADMLKDSQDEISTAKNQRTDAITFGILGINRVSPQNKNIDKNFTIFPGACMPFGDGEFEHFSIGEAAMAGVSLENESMMIQQAIERAGVGPPASGLGAGSGKIGAKGQIQFGSMGTLAVLQANNTRSSHRLSDFRHSHVKLISLLTSMYGAMGLGRKGTLFGMDEKILTEALQDVLEHRVRIPIRASEASSNKEVDKANGMLFMQVMRQHHQSISTLLQALSNPNVPDEAKKYFAKVIDAQNFMFQRLLRDFGYEQVKQFAPEPDIHEQEKTKRAGLLQMAASLRQPGGIHAPGGTGGMEGGFGGPPSSSGLPPVQGGPSSSS